MLRKIQTPKVTILGHPSESHFSLGVLFQMEKFPV